jgi:hypothetical protein
METGHSSGVVHRALRLFLESLLVCWLTIPILAQFTTARLGGAVLDPSGAGLAGAKVSVKDVLTSYTKGTTTNSSGGMSFPACRLALTRLA